MIRKLEKIKTLQGFEKFSGWRSRRNLPWVTQGMSCKPIYQSEFVKVYFTCRAGMMINPQILEISLYVTTIKLCRFRTRSKTWKTRKPRRISFPRFFTPSFSFGTIPKTENSELKTSEFSPRHFDQTRRFSNSELFILH